MRMSSLYSDDLQSSDLNPVEHIWDVVELQQLYNSIMYLRGF